MFLWDSRALQQSQSSRAKSIKHKLVTGGHVLWCRAVLALCVCVYVYTNMRLCVCVLCVSNDYYRLSACATGHIPVKSHLNRIKRRATTAHQRASQRDRVRRARRARVRVKINISIHTHARLPFISVAHMRTRVHTRTHTLLAYLC